MPTSGSSRVQECRLKASAIAARPPGRLRRFHGQQRVTNGNVTDVSPCPITDPLTGEVRMAEIFVAVLGASSLTYAEATWSQTLPDGIGSHV